MIKMNRTLSVLMFATFTNYIGFVVPMFLSLFLHEEGHSLGVIGYILTAYGFGGFIGGYLGGYLSDKTSPFQVIIVSLTISISALVGIFFSESLYLLSFLLLTFGFSDHAFRPAFTMLLVNNTSEEKRTYVFGIRNAVMNISIGISAAAGAAVFDLNVKYIFLFDAFLNVITLILLLSFSPKLVTTTRQILSSEIESSIGWKNLNSTFIFLSLVMVLNVIVFSQFKTTFAIYLKEVFNFSSKDISFIFLLNTLLVIFIEVPLIAFTARFNQVRLMLLGSCALCFGFAAISLSSNYTFPFLSVIVWTVGEMLFFPIILNEFVKASTNHRGKVVGWHQTLFATGNFLGAPIGFYFYQYLDGDAVWLLCAAIGFVSLFALPILSFQKSRQEAVNAT
ncbi:MFS transporter [Reinekea blandensis]|uniref:Major facilitator superfamily (MFS) profile domain-containing protein n=1 Tax=Reinekea blandensis MED297 TaxID=314283 RepID=A4BAS3_9GAMM|nr:MFS transporter [Reinekea blandensis]EAR11029.1 hypothetical protein MED297_10976 [Reinekea sp. MED297] [Reinekea blandensis MED297]